MTEPLFPDTLHGTVWGSAMWAPQYPLRTGTMESLATMIAPRMAVATSLAHLTPRPTWLQRSAIFNGVQDVLAHPSKSPTATKALNLVL